MAEAEPAIKRGAGPVRSSNRERSGGSHARHGQNRWLKSSPTRKRCQRRQAGRSGSCRKRLDQVADEGAINALAGVMQSFLGTKPRPPAGAGQTERGIRFDTAQFHDIQRYPKRPDGFRYVTILWTPWPHDGSRGARARRRANL